VKRSRVQEELGIKTDNTIRNKIATLKSKGLVETYQRRKNDVAWVSFRKVLLIHPLIRYEYAIIYSMIKRYEEEIYNSNLRTVYGHINNTINSIKSVSLLPKNNNINIGAISKNNKCVEYDDFDTLISTLLAKLIAEITSTQKTDSKETNNDGNKKSKSDDTLDDDDDIFNDLNYDIRV